MAIIISGDGKPARKVRKTDMAKEVILQEYVAQNPDSLPLDELKDDMRLMVIGREFPTASGPIDVLACDADGELYIIETKLFKNADKRRVVAQMLDYGAAIWATYGNPDGFLADVETFVSDAGGGTFRQRLRECFTLEDEQVDQVLVGVRQNLLNGSMRFLVLMDSLDDRLRDLIRFINQKSKFDIYAVEMEFYRHENLEIVIPKLYGNEVQKETGRGGPTAAKYIWDSDRFFKAAADQLSPEQVTAVRNLFDFSMGSGQCELKNCDFQARNAMVQVTFPSAAKKPVYTFRTDGALILNLGWLEQDRKGSTLCGRFQEALKRAGLDVPDDHDGKPRWEINQWGPKVENFKAAVNESVGRR